MTDKYHVENPIITGIKGVYLASLTVLAMLFVGIVHLSLFIGACLLLAFRVLIALSKKLLPLAILILLGVVAYKLWYL